MDQVTSPTSNPFITPSRVLYAMPGLGQFLYLLRTIGRSLKYFIDSAECKLSKARPEKTKNHEVLFEKTSKETRDIPNKISEVENLKNAKSTNSERLSVTTNVGRFPILKEDELEQAKFYYDWCEEGPILGDDTCATERTIQIGSTEHDIIPQSIQPFQSKGQERIYYRRSTTGLSSTIHYDNTKREVVVGFHGYGSEFGLFKHLFAIIRNILGFTPGLFEDASLLVGDMKQQVDFLNHQIFLNHIDEKLEQKFPSSQNVSQFEEQDVIEEKQEKPKTLSPEDRKLVRAFLLGEIHESLLPKSIRTNDLKDLKNLQQEALREAKKQEIKLTVAGHSMGGALASYASLKNGVKGFVFNPLPLGLGSRKEIGADRLNEAHHFLTEVFVPGDWVSDRIDPVENAGPLMKAFITAQKITPWIFGIGPKLGPLGTARRFALLMEEGEDKHRPNFGKNNYEAQMFEHRRKEFHQNCSANVQKLVKNKKDPISIAKDIINDVFVLANVKVYNQTATYDFIFDFNDLERASQRGNVKRLRDEVVEAKSKLQNPTNEATEKFEAVIKDLENLIKLYDKKHFHSHLGELLKQFPNQSGAGLFVDELLREMKIFQQPLNTPIQLGDLFDQNYKGFAKNFLEALDKRDVTEDLQKEKKITALMTDLHLFFEKQN